MICLTRLHPRFVGQLRPNSGETLQFDCPACGPSHTLNAPFTNPIDGGPAMGNSIWAREGTEFDALTLRPSIQYPCWHGWIEDGVVIGIEESPAAIRQPDGTMVALSPRQFASARAGRPIA